MRQDVTKRLLGPLLIAILIALAVSPWWATGRLLAPLDILHELYEPWAAGDTTVEVHNHFTSDAVTQYIVYRDIAESAFDSGEPVGWNGLAFAGNPESSNTMASHFDWSMQLHRGSNFWTAWHLGIAGHLAIAAYGMYLFLRGRGIRSTTALIGAIAYAGNTQFVLYLFHRWQIAAFAWIPWLLWSMFRARERRKGMFLPPLFICLAVLGGNLQSYVFVGLVLLAVLIAWLADADSRCIPTTMLVWGWGTLGFGLAAFALFPEIAAFLDNVSTGHVRGGIGEGWDLTQPVRGILFYALSAFPPSLGSPQGIDLSKVLGRDLFDLAYFGLVPLLVAWIALARRTGPRESRTLMLVGVLIPLTPLVGPLYFRVAVLFILGGIWAFAAAWDDPDTLPTVSVRAIRILSAVGVLWVIASVGLAIAGEPIRDAAENAVASRLAEGEGTFGVFDQWMRSRARRLLDDVAIWRPRNLVFAGAAVIGLLAWRTRLNHPARSSLLLLLAVLLELGTFYTTWVTWVDPSLYPPYPVTEDIGVLQDVAGDGRVIVFQEEDEPRLFPSNTLVPYGVANIDQYESIRPPSMWQLASFRTDSATLGRLAVTHAITHPDSPPRQPDGWRLAYEGQTFDIWENLSSLPRYLAAASPDGMDFEPLPHQPRLIVSETQNQKTVQLPPGIPGVRIAENHNEGWRFRIDGGPWEQVGRLADGSMYVATGESGLSRTVELAYRPLWAGAGLGTSLGALIALLLMAVVGSRWDLGNRRRAPSSRRILEP